MADTTTQLWDATLESEAVVTFRELPDGKKQRIVVKKRWVELKRGAETVVFPIGEGKPICKGDLRVCGRKCQCPGKLPVFTDNRETGTGAQPLTNRGPLPGEAYTKSGRPRKLTPTAWGAEVERMIGGAAVGRIMVELITKHGFAAC